jgi:hypothetical protein
MAEELSESGIVRKTAGEAAWRVTRKVVASLRRMEHTLSGDDSGLKTTWDEICVQVQHEHSFAWDAYEETVRATVAGCLAQLAEHERQAIWLQTDPGIAWDRREPADRETNPVCDDDIVGYLADEYVLAEAGRRSNARVRAYIDRASMSD